MGSGQIVSEDVFIESGDPGIRLFLRNKRPAVMTGFTPARTLLFCHGGSQAGEVTFDLALDGMSWLDYVAARGWDVWLVDIRGFGKSTRPPEMDQPAETVPPLVRTEVAWRDFGAAVAHILKARGIPALNALGWSWGTMIAGGWAAHHPGIVRRLVLFGAAWPDRRRYAVPKVGYDTWTVAETLRRLQTGAPEAARSGLTPAHWIAAWAEATVATDPKARTFDPPRVRSPNGMVLDLEEAQRLGRPLYPAGRIDGDVLLVTGEWDALTAPDKARMVFDALTGARSRRLTVLGGATHFAHLECRRLELYAAVQGFLEEGA